MEGSCEHGNEPLGSVKRWKFLSSCTTGGFSRRAEIFSKDLSPRIVSDDETSTFTLLGLTFSRQ
jgi:hypothetical protein